MRLAEISVAKEHNEFDWERQALVATNASNFSHCAVVNNELTITDIFNLESRRYQLISTIILSHGAQKVHVLFILINYIRNDLLSRPTHYIVILTAFSQINLSAKIS